MYKEKVRKLEGEEIQSGYIKHILWNNFKIEYTDKQY